MEDAAVLDSEPHDAPSAVARHHQSDDARQLRRTRDYRALTAVVQELRRQREQALHDIARLALLRERALAAPVPFVLRLKRDRACLDSSSHDGNSDANAAARGGGRGQGDRGDDDVDDDAERPQHDAEEESYADDPAAGPMLPLPRRQFVARLPRVDLHRYAYASRPRGPRQSTTATTTPTTTTTTTTATTSIATTTTTTTTTSSSLAVASGEKEATHDQGREMSERVASSSNAPIPHHDAGGGGGGDDQMDEVLDGGQVPNAGTGTARETDSSAAAGLQRIKQEEAERPTGHGEGRSHHYDDDDVHVAPVAAAVKREGGVKEEFPPGEGSLPREEPKAGDVIRGRVWDEDKPSTFNKLWTPDEQRRLELLLLEIPDEEVAAHRWSKIARALGNRTPRQVASRVQKHFIKLARAGLPVPGKPPNLDACLRKRRKTAHHHQQQQPTHSGMGSGPEGAAAYYTLPPVQMPDDDDEEDDDDDDDEEAEDEVGASNGEAKGTLGAQPAASFAFGKGEGQQQQPYDDEDYRTYRAQAPNYLDPAFMPS